MYLQMHIYMCLNFFKLVLSWLNYKPFIFNLWNSVLPNPSVNNSPIRSHNLWLFRSTVDSIFRTITAFCAYPEDGFFFPQLRIWTAKWHFSTDLHLCLHLLFYENNLICCLFLEIFPSWCVSLFSFLLSSCIVLFLLITGQTVHAVGSSYKLIFLTDIPWHWITFC